MLRSMYSGISGLKVNQTKLDVIGNNIANVGTTAFKNQRIRFQDVLSQNLKFGTGASANVGGTNPSQVGLGVEVAGIDTMVSQGNMQPTGRNLDFAVDGDGYFVVARGKAKGKLEVEDDGTVQTTNDDLKVNYTRDGSFALDDFGQLLTSDGYRVLGYLPEGVNIRHSATASTAPTLTIGEDGEASGAIQPLVIPDEVTVKLSEEAKAAAADSAAKATKAAEAAAKEAKADYDKAKDDYDKAEAAAKEAKDDYDKAKADYDEAKADYEDNPTDTTKTNFEIAKSEKDGKEAAKKAADTTLKSAKVALDDANAAVVEAQEDVAAALAATTAANADTVRSKVKNFSVDKNGAINAVLASNEVVTIGQIAMASFKNPAGLFKEGKNLYSTSASSGEALYRNIDGATSSNEKGFGDIIQGRLEMSNVDLAEQFTEMIVASRAFQANGKIITTGDEILQDLVNLKR